jgi:hypothetical protein
MKRFKNGNNTDRDIYIKISSDEIKFYFVKDYDRHQEWLYEMQLSCVDVDEEDLVPPSFYYIEKKQWYAKVDSILAFDIKNHMQGKNWFTKEMYEYINQQ